MLMAVEQRATLVQMIASGEGSQDELRKQLAWKDEYIAHLEDISKLKDEKIQMYIDKEKIYQDKEKTNQSFSDMKDKACQEQVKAATPSFMDKLKSNFLAGGIGAVLAAVVILLL